MSFPLLLVYEASVWSSGGGYRNSAEMSLSYLLDLAGAQAVLLRWCVCAALFLVCLVRVHRRGVVLLPALVRTGLEGLAAAVLIGPLLIALLTLLPESAQQLSLPSAPLEKLPSLERLGLWCAGALYEEFLFRVLLYGLLFLIGRRTLLFLGLHAGSARWAAEFGAALGQALLFACFHLRSVLFWLGEGGEPFQPALFAWRVLAGLLLALVCRWRGLGVAAYGHAGFNAALALGAGPGVFL